MIGPLISLKPMHIVPVSWLLLTLNNFLLVQIEQQKHQNKMWILFKVTNKDTRTTSVLLVSLLLIWTDFMHSSVFIADFEHVFSQNLDKNLWGNFSENRRRSAISFHYKSNHRWFFVVHKSDSRINGFPLNFCLNSEKSS